MESTAGHPNRLGRVLVYILIVGLFGYIASPLILPVAMGAVFAVLFWPWRERLVSRKWPSWLASTVLTIGITFLVLLPTAFFVFVGIKEALKQIKFLQALPFQSNQRVSTEDSTGAEGQVSQGESFFETILNSEAVQNVLDQISHWYPITFDELVFTAQGWAQDFALKLADVLGKGLASVPMILVAMAVIVVSIFFFLLDGGKLVRLIRKASVFRPHQTEEMIYSVGSMCRSVILATLISGLIQSLIFLIACLAFGQGNLVIILFLVIVSSFVPLLGSTPVTLSVAVYQLIIGNTGAGVALAFVGIFVTALDNVIRPLVMKGASNLHPLLAFVGAFGGLQVLGIAGIFIGPIVAGLFVATFNILAER